MTLSLFLDIVVAFLLAGTIYFVWRLSEQLNRFRQNRAEMDRVVRELNIAIERSQMAINGMRASADTAGAELQKKILSATELSDELQLMSESGNALATRMERAAGTAIPLTGEGVSSASAVRTAPREDTPVPSFAIRDPEFDAGRAPTGMDDWAGDDDFQSDAERELFKAVQKNKTQSRSVV